MSSSLSALKCVLVCFAVAFFVLAGNTYAQGPVTCETHTPSVPPTNKDALIALYCATDGENWTDNTNWLTDMPLSAWADVTATDPDTNTPTPGDNNDDIVTDLYPINNNLSGTIPDLSTLTSLQFLSLFGNELTGEIPNLSTLTSLEKLELSQNNLSGTIPDLSTLTSLQYLYLSGNELTGKIPDLSTLTNLQFLYLFGNELTGGIPDLSTLTNLQFLVLNNNMLSGGIPDLSTLTSLEELDLSQNNLSGTIPDLSTLTSLQYLSLFGNELTGGIPDLSTLTSLQYLYLWGNELTGGIPDLSTLTSLVRLSLSRNMLSGTIPDLSTLTNLKRLYLNNNMLSEGIPDLSTLTSLQYLYLWGNKLTGGIPDLSTLTNLERLYLNNNMLSGGIPDLSTLTSLQYLYLWGNELTGGIPDLSTLTSLVELDLDSNQLSGTIPDLSTLTNLRWLYLSGNELTGTIPDLSTLTNLERLYLNNNMLTGSVPTTELGALANLEELGLWGNEGLTWGTISNGLGKRVDRGVLRTLYVVNGGEDWNNNEKWFSSEEDPMEIFSFSSWSGVSTDATTGRVSGLDLSSNNMTGEITSALEALGGLKELDISYNRQLTGELPLRLMDLPLETLDIRCTEVDPLPGDTAFQMWLSGISFQGTCPPPVISPPPVQPLEQVMGVRVRGEVEQLSVSWSSVSEADGYKVQWKSGSQQFDSSHEHTITNGSTTSYTISNLVSGTEYTVRVIATKSGANVGMPSQEVTGTPTAPEPPPAPPEPSSGGCAIASDRLEGNTSKSALLNLLLVGSAMFLVVSREGR